MGKSRHRTSSGQPEARTRQLAPVRQNLAWSNFNNDLALCSIGCLKNLDAETQLQYWGFFDRSGIETYCYV